MQRLFTEVFFQSGHFAAALFGSSLLCSQTLWPGAMASDEEDWVGDAAGGGGIAGAPEAMELSEEDWVGSDSPAQVPDAPPPLPPPPEHPGVDEVEEEPAPRMTRAQAAHRAREAKAAKAKAVADAAAQRASGGASSSAVARFAGFAADQMKASGIAKLLCRTTQSESSSFLKPAKAHAEECGIARQRYRPHLWSHSEALLGVLQDKATRLVEYCCMDSQSEGEAVPMLFVRQRKYDETNSRIVCWWDQGEVLDESLD